MRLPAASRALLVCLGIGFSWLTAVAFGQQEVQSAAVAVSSPDGNYRAYWVDLLTTQGLQARRLIFIVDAASNQLLFTHLTFQRHTGAIWNRQSTACGIFDAPDNANVYLWIIRKQSDSDRTWVVRKIDLEKLTADMKPDAFAQNPVRMGIEKLSWEADEALIAQLIVNGSSINVKVPVR